MPTPSLPQPSELLLSQCSDIGTCFQAIFNLLAAILIALSFLFFVFGAFQYILSAANIYNAQEGKNRMKNSLIALIILLIFPALMYFVNANIFANITLFIPKVKVTLPEYDPNIPGTFPGASDENEDLPDDIIKKYSFNPYKTKYKCDVPRNGISGCDSSKIGNKIRKMIGRYDYQAADRLALICLYESRGNSRAESFKDRCTDGNPFSIGLFQINMAVHNFKTKDNMDCNFNEIFKFDNYKTNGRADVYSCRVTNKDKYDKCVEALKDPEFNMQLAIKIAQSDRGLKHWSTWILGVKDCFPADGGSFRIR